MEFLRNTSRTSATTEHGSWHKWADVCILIFINFCNYNDRYSLAGILIDVQAEFDIRNEAAGLIQTLFIVPYTLSAPVFGFFGDRYNRKYILAFGVGLWNAATVACSFSNTYWLFLLFRSVMGLGQACFTTVSPSIISDLFVGDRRSRLLAIFYTAIPVGNGMAYVVGAQATELLGTWRWSLRVPVFVGVMNVLLILLVLRHPQRGEVEGRHMSATPWTKDLVYLLTNKSFMFCTLGFTAVAFTAGVTTWWAPKLNVLGFRLHRPDVNQYTESSLFGIVSMVSGFLGLLIGYVATFQAKESYPPVDPLVCAVGLVISAPLMTGATYASMSDRITTYALLFGGFVFMNLNWALTVDICMNVVVPSRRALAMGMQLLIGHTFGDAGSPSLTGLISDRLYDHYQEVEEKETNEFYSLQHAYFLGMAVELLAGVFFFLNAAFIMKDLLKIDEGAQNEEQAEAAKSQAK